MLRSRALWTILALTAAAILLGSGLAWADDAVLPQEPMKGWDVNWHVVWSYMSKDVYLQRVGLAFLLSFTVGVQMIFFPAYYWIFKLNPSSAIRMAYFAGTAIFLFIFVRIYWDLIILMWLSYWGILIEVLLFVALVLWLIMLPKKVMA